MRLCIGNRETITILPYGISDAIDGVYLGGRTDGSENTCGDPESVYENRSKLEGCQIQVAGEIKAAVKTAPDVKTIMIVGAPATDPALRSAC
jgi:hypothetical protein